MTPTMRWIRFNVVGVLGMAVQLAALDLLYYLLHGHYLIASAAALEVALLHNFVWHMQYTWRDRRGGFSRWRQLLRFHLSNGLLSLAGNLVLMRLLVHAAHLPVLLANAVAALCCSAANFWLSQRWTFSQSPQFARDTAVHLHGHCPSSARGSTRRTLDLAGGAGAATGRSFYPPAAYITSWTKFF